MANTPMLVLLAALKTMPLTVDLDPQQVYCMASTIYGEARGTSILDQQKVASVVLNRVEASKRAGKPQRICTIVRKKQQFQGYGKPIQNVDFRNKQRMIDWEIAVEISIHSMAGLLNDYTNGATHFAEYNVKPYWAKEMVVTDASGVHIFYKKDN